MRIFKPQEYLRRLLSTSLGNETPGYKGTIPKYFPLVLIDP
jgi:hypothetical protein